MTLIEGLGDYAVAMVAGIVTLILALGGRR